MLTIIQNPPDVGFSDAPIFLKIQTTSENEYIKLEVIDAVNTSIVYDIHSLTFSPNNRQTTIDIHAAFAHLKPPLPPDATIGINSTYVILTDSFCKYKVRITSMLTNEVIETPHYVALFGNAKNFVPHPNYANELYIAHTTISGYAKKVTKEQPDYLVLYAKRRIENIYIETTIFVSTGYRVNIQPYQGTNILPEGVLVAIPCGYTQQKLYNELIDNIGMAIPYGIYITGFNVSVWQFWLEADSNGLSFAWNKRMLAQKSFLLENIYPKNSMYIAYENGVGGIDVEWFPIIKSDISEIAKTQTSRFFWADEGQAHRIGQREEDITEESNKITIKTNLLSRFAIKVIRKMLSSQMWIVNIDDYKFERVYCETKEISMPSIQDRNGFIEITIKKYI